MGSNPIGFNALKRSLGKGLINPSPAEVVGQGQERRALTSPANEDSSLVSRSRASEIKARTDLYVRFNAAAEKMGSGAAPMELIERFRSAHAALASGELRQPLKQNEAVALALSLHSRIQNAGQNAIATSISEVTVHRLTSI